LMGEGTYQVQSTEQVVFRSGRLKAVDTAVPEDCGCAAPATPVLTAAATNGPVVSDENLSVKMRLAQPGDEARPWPEEPLPAPLANDVHVQVEAPLVFNASAATPPQPTLEAQLAPVVDSRLLDPLPTIVLAPFDAQTDRPRHGFFGKVKGFFVSVFR
jgi:hypothetical protein